MTAYTTWVAKALAAGEIAPGVARELNQAARTMLAAIKTEAGLDEMEQLREMLRRAEAAAEQRKQNEVSARFGGSVVGEFDLTDTKA